MGLRALSACLSIVQNWSLPNPMGIPAQVAASSEYPQQHSQLCPQLPLQGSSSSLFSPKPPCELRLVGDKGPLDCSAWTPIWLGVLALSSRDWALPEPLGGNFQQNDADIRTDRTVPAGMSELCRLLPPPCPGSGWEPRSSSHVTPRGRSTVTARSV